MNLWVKMSGCLFLSLLIGSPQMMKGAVFPKTKLQHTSDLSQSSWLVNLLKAYTSLVTPPLHLNPPDLPLEIQAGSPVI